MIHYVTGDATDPQGEGYKIIAHVVNNRGVQGSVGKGRVLNDRGEVPGVVAATGGRGRLSEGAGKADRVQHNPPLPGTIREETTVAEVPAGSGSYPAIGIQKIPLTGNLGGDTMGVS